MIASCKEPIVYKSAIDAPSDPIFTDHRMLKFHDIRLFELGKFMPLLPNSFKILSVSITRSINTIQEMLTLLDCPYVELTLDNSP